MSYHCYNPVRREQVDGNNRGPILLALEAGKHPNVKDIADYISTYEH
jgi:hypothetical protein